MSLLNSLLSDSAKTTNIDFPTSFDFSITNIADSISNYFLESTNGNANFKLNHNHLNTNFKTSFIDYDTKFKVPLCDDLDDVVLRVNETCYSECGAVPFQRECPTRVIEPGLKFRKHSSCKSHVECVGKEERTLCQAVPDGGSSGVLGLR